MLVEQGTILN